MYLTLKEELMRLRNKYADRYRRKGYKSDRYNRKVIDFMINKIRKDKSDRYNLQREKYNTTWIE